VLAAETAVATSLTAAMRADAPVTLARVDTIARNLTAPGIAEGAFAQMRGW
jgi:hypothetical protein